MNFFAIFTILAMAVASASASALDGKSFETTGELTERGCVCSGGCHGGAICCQDPCGCGFNC
ncbi:hypothetical protein CYLTODRAFT_426866 [Cylindrobasidium torrendii FP15055 ss-10]|uniref:Metallothionein n=1 Tax=Cylindrobasidium torrendii FP15055 ss-10 TaxID=1314674 RepID=A0A0D7AYZ4_9AGAR|nr:hypothetical protein CYLTODRAFT_426866 [Cylindrobasidium torrendii FP15055 ss-10]